MRLERISVNQFKIFLTYDDLNERGYSKEDLWNNLPRANQLLQDMLYEASEELEMDLDGRLMVRVHMLQAQGMIIVVTQNQTDVEEEYIELKVTMDESKEMMFVFQSFEEVVELSHLLFNKHVTHNSIYSYDDLYYLLVNEHIEDEKKREDLISIISEYASPSTMTSSVLKEYGAVIAENNAVEVITNYFN
ncbi:adaptor protein MecA [Halalkalibacillus halophilus]|uniref:adaptor protein MecA n=1 Tax=Halalkalibacillus halophilus TaxID=392827 RepID=UPI00041B6B16|nr:adaptor protein MecA [Halalkalibacillus halophilus]